MPLSRRPLFLVPSLMRELPDVGAVMVDLTDLAAGEVTATSATAAANALLDQLEPLVVEANLAGYEITVIAATTGTATTSCLVLNVEAFLVDSANEPWNTVVTGVNVPFGASVKAALALRFEPRLALRDAVDDGSVIASSYGIEFDTPSGWLGSVDPDQGGWLVTTTATQTTLPGGLTSIAGRPGNPATPASALLAAIRAAATTRWQAHGRTVGQLQHCALAPLFDPSTWQVPAGDAGVGIVSAVLSDYLWDSASGWVPAYGDLAGWTLEEALTRGGGHAAAVLALDEIRSALREELARRHLVDPKAIDGVSRREGELGPRFDELFAAVETVGQPLLAVDLFRLLELGLLSLDRRVADEEMLPVLVEREWTEPVLTGFYDSVGAITSIPIGELLADADARWWFDAVAAEAVVLSINQAGDHLEGFWHERQYDPGSDRPAKVVEWFAAGERDHSRPGLVYDVEWQSGPESMVGTYTFREVGDALEVVAEWDATASVEAGTMTFHRRDLPQPVFEPGADEAVDPPSPMVRAFRSTGEIDALPADVRESIRIEERYSLHPAEIVLLDAIVGRIAADLGAIAGTSGQSSQVRMALCTNTATAFGYFVRGTRLSEHAPTARRYVLAALKSMPGNNTPVDSWSDYAPETYFHALAKAHQEFACIPDRIAECLGITRQELAWFAADNTYRYRFHTSLLPSTKALQDFTLGEVTERLVKLLATKGVMLGTKVAKVVYAGVAPKIDAIEAEIQKLGPYPDANWPRTADAPQSVWYDGWLVGLALTATAGMSVSTSSEWSTLNALGDVWSPDDFAGWLVNAGIFWGYSVFGLETLFYETPVNWVREQLGLGPTRASGDVSYTKFLAPPKADLWSISTGLTNSLGLHVEIGAGVTPGYLWRRGAPEPDLDEVLPPGADAEPLRIAGISFDVGRSELTPDGHALLRQAAADRLHELADPSTALDVLGHASFGDARPLYNLTLSQRRAANVVRALEAYLGPLYAVRPERTTVIGLGDQQAEEDGGPPEQWRRVDVFINGRHAVELRTGGP